MGNILFLRVNVSYVYKRQIAWQNSLQIYANITALNILEKLKESLRSWNVTPLNFKNALFPEHLRTASSPKILYLLGLLGKNRAKNILFWLFFCKVKRGKTNQRPFQVKLLLLRRSTSHWQARLILFSARVPFLCRILEREHCNKSG